MTTRNDAGYFVPLSHSLVPTNGSGPPTLTRSTVMWLYPDNERKMVSVPASAAAFGGARMVRNLLASPDVLATQGVTTLAATYTISFYGTGSVAFSGTYAGASLTGTGVGDRVQRTFTATAGTLTLTVTGSVTTAQLENVTGQSDQTASEYVVGDNGAGINNLKWFNTNKAGAPIPPSSLLGLATNEAAVTNTMLWCRDFTWGFSNTIMGWQAPGLMTGATELLTNGDFASDTAWIKTGDWVIGGGVASIASASSASNLSQYVLETGENYVVTFTIASGLFSGYIFVGGDRFRRYTNLAPGTYTISSHSIGSSSPTLFRMQASIGVTCSIDNISVKKSDILVTQTGTGLDKATNSSSLLTARASNATILQTITAAAAAGCTGWYVTRSVGSGNIYITRDNGVNWTDITSQINSDTPTLVKIENTTVLDPVVGFKISTSGDAIIVDCGINHLGTKLHPLPIPTTSAAITVGPQTLTYPTAGNISDAAGTILATVNQSAWSDGGVVGSTTRGLFSSTANKGAQAKDGTNTNNGPTGTPSGEERIGMRWSGSSMQTYADAEFGAAGSYDGNLNLSTISIMSGVTGYIRDVAIWSSSLADADMIEASGTINILGTPATISVSEASGTMLIGNVINGVADQITMTFPDGLVLIGRTIDGVADTITMTAPSGSVLYDNAPRSTVTINGLYAQKTITAKL